MRLVLYIALFVICDCNETFAKSKLVVEWQGVSIHMDDHQWHVQFAHQRGTVEQGDRLQGHWQRQRRLGHGLVPKTSSGNNKGWPVPKAQSEAQLRSDGSVNSRMVLDLVPRQRWMDFSGGQASVARFRSTDDTKITSQGGHVVGGRPTSHQYAP